MKQPRIILAAPAQHPDTAQLRKQLRAAMLSLGWMPAWEERQPGDPALPKALRSHPGPLVLAGSRAVALDSPERMAESLTAAAKAQARWAWLRKPLEAGSVVPGILLAFFPKCAGCWAAYFSVFNSMGVAVPYMPWLRHVLSATLILSAAYFWWMARRRGRWLPFGVQVAGFAFVLAAQYALKAPALLWIGVGLVFAGSLLWAMPPTWARRLERVFQRGEAVAG